ncbi:MAG: glycosyltransferase [Proteobacteria bacterium]|nr:glycosyltransferase [Pseudomonadota bacterium]
MTEAALKRKGVADLSPTLYAVVALAALIIVTAFFSHSFANKLLATSTFLYILAMLTKHSLFWLGVMHPQDLIASELYRPAESELPCYSIIVALYNEAAIVPHLIAALSAIDYPRHKLQILLVLEADDISTKTALQDIDHSKFHILTAPKRIPQTKAGACNYALSHATGELIAVYDAEDKPHPQQLQQIAHLYQNQNAECIQCRLGFYNAQENLLTKMFAIEYAALFDYTLPNLARLRTPMLLGGSSNHFSKATLMYVGGWDNYNVTEDADLGLYLYNQSYAVRVTNSTTLEEAPLSLYSWMKQRARWLKGHMLTYLVYLQQPQERLAMPILQRCRDKIVIHLWLGCSTIATLASPIILLLWLVTAYKTGSISSVGMRAYSILIASHFLLSWAQGLCICRKKALGASWIGYPFYFIAHLLAACIALKQLFFAPYKWDKTPHGQSYTTLCGK